jgi:hypothetical protein
MAFHIETVCADILGRKDFERVTDTIYVDSETRSVCLLGTGTEALLIMIQEEETSF